MAKDVKPNFAGGALPPKPPITKEEFGRRLYKLMSAKGWNQAELGRRAGIGRDSVSNYMKFKSFPTAISLEKMAKALGADADEILPGHASSTVLAERPDYKIEGIPGNPDYSWVYVNRPMPNSAASKIYALIVANDRKDAPDAG